MENEKIKKDTINSLLNSYKGEVCKQFEKVCPTDRSFDRIKKEMHDLFDELEENLKKRFS